MAGNGFTRTLNCLQQQQDGLALEHASQEMKGDRELCTAAVAQDGLALEHASQEMKGCVPVRACACLAEWLGRALLLAALLGVAWRYSVACSRLQRRLGGGSAVWRGSSGSYQVPRGSGGQVVVALAGQWD